ncbi:hypothetical protein E1281_20515 [Actinomadura sp. KC345]|uniref:hypothetical protein n=1 Tax=Actinomadura sp. KC345 TaxID=2530371 RepID=UPI0010506DBE|nr:hypothetical protein [Actinomadura sp. KC345]TDC51437.1 hypothetical protein E1281_20515 [Actinomadura sp. KC345]
MKNARAERVKADIEFTTRGYGSSKPIADNSTAAGAARNRRVSVSIPCADDTAGGARRTPGAPATPTGGSGRPMSQFAATATTPEAPADKARLKGVGLQRIAAGTVLLSYRMTNLRDSTERLAPFWPAPSHTVLSSLGGTTVTDAATSRIYQTMVVDRRSAVGPAAAWAHCACSLTSAGTSFVPYGKTRTLYALLPVPETAPVVDVHIGTDDNLIFRNAQIN